MGVSIDIKTSGRWVDITPGWRSQAASWLKEIGGDRDLLVFTAVDLPALRYRRRFQRRGQSEPPFDQSSEWTDFFDRIIRQIKRHGEALVRLNY